MLTHDISDPSSHEDHLTGRQHPLKDRQVLRSRLVRIGIILVILLAVGVALGSMSVTADGASINFDDQATDSSTISNDRTDPSVVVEAINNEDSSIAITFEDEGNDTIAGVGNFEADELEGETPVGITNTDGFPGEHTAHLIEEAVINEDEIGSSLGETDGEIVTEDSATVFRGTLEFEDQEFESSVSDEITVATTDLEGPTDDFLVRVHPTDDDNIDDEFVGSSAELSGENEDVAITLEDNIEIEETDDFVAMIHLVDDDEPEITSYMSVESDESETETFSVLQNADGEDGFVDGGVADDATIVIDEPSGNGDGDDSSLPGLLLVAGIFALAAAGAALFLSGSE